MAAGDLDAAVDVEIVSRKIKHWRRAHAGQHHVGPAFGQAADQRRFEHSAVRAAVATHGYAPGPFVERKRRKGASERIGVRFGQCVADDAADVVFAEDGGVETMGHAAALTRRMSIGSTD